MEKLAVDSPAPYRDVSRHALVVEHGGHAFRRGVDLFAALIKPPQNRLAHRLEPGHAIIAKIGLEPRMDGGDRRDVVALRPRHRPVPEELRRAAGREKVGASG